jgi:hypothetical protein
VVAVFPVVFYGVVNGAVVMVNAAVTAVVSSKAVMT